MALPRWGMLRDQRLGQWHDTPRSIPPCVMPRSEASP
jgi:hypothetical protein